VIALPDDCAAILVVPDAPLGVAHLLLVLLAP
jgi:hypothetical protein